MQVIAFFYYNKKRFVIVKRNNELLCYLNEKNKNKFELNEEEKSIFSKVMYEITPTLEYTFFVKVKSYNNKFYKLYFNPQKNLYYTDSLDRKIISHVNFRYNHISENCYINNNQNNRNNESNSPKELYFKRIVKIGKKIIFVNTLSILSLNLLVGCSILPKVDENIQAIVNQNQETQGNDNIVSYEKTEQPKYDFSMIEQVLEDNQNLNDEEKNFIKKLKFIFDENYQYMDMELIKERILNLKIRYEPNKKENLGGVYNIPNNEIILYNSNGFEDCQLFPFVHEFLHVLQNPSNDFLKELSNEFFSRETVRRLYDNGDIDESKMKTKNYTIVPIFGDGYDEYIPIYYILAELLDREDLRKYQFECDSNIIIKGLSENSGTNSNQENAYSFIVDINSARTFNEETQMFELVSQFEAADIHSKCYDDLNYYYKRKKACEIKEDLKISINYYENPWTSYIIIDKFTPYTKEENERLKELLIQAGSKEEEKVTFGMYRVVIPRTYLSEEHENPTISFNSIHSIPTVEITDELAEEFATDIKRLKKEEEELLVLP